NVASPRIEAFINSQSSRLVTEPAFARLARERASHLRHGRSNPINALYNGMDSFIDRVRPFALADDWNLRREPSRLAESAPDRPQRRLLGIDRRSRRREHIHKPRAPHLGRLSRRARSLSRPSSVLASSRRRRRRRRRAAAAPRHRPLNLIQLRVQRAFGETRVDVVHLPTLARARRRRRRARPPPVPVVLANVIRHRARAIIRPSRVAPPLSARAQRPNHRAHRSIGVHPSRAPRRRLGVRRAPRSMSMRTTTASS
ncbi:hypothetical protein BE221DRAFT_167156, partial [Ostreococcus tauri]